MKRKVILLLIVSFCFMSSVFARNYSFNIGMANGDSSSKVYTVGARKYFVPLSISNAFSIDPYLEFQGYSIDPKHYGSSSGIAVVGGLEFNLPRAKTYLSVSTGPSYLSNRVVGNRDLGGHFNFASSAALGYRFSGSHSLEAFVTHFSHAGLNGSQNSGFSLYGLSYRLTF